MVGDSEDADTRSGGEYRRSVCFHIFTCMPFFVCFNLRSNSHAPEDVLPACQTTLKNLQLDYLDLYLVSSYFHLGLLLYIVCC